jgi:surfactin synthase thioesterase subunit
MIAGRDGIVRISPAGTYQLALVCIPHAGAGAGVFYNWKYALNGTGSVWAVCLPGREKRILEAPLSTIEEMADSLLSQLSDLPAKRLVLFGHCSGALVGYELAHRLTANSSSLPCTGLIVSAQSLPKKSSGTRMRVADLPVQALIERLRKINGMPEAALSNHQLMETIAPAIRADMQALEQYSIPQGRPPLELPILAVGGRSDRSVKAAQLASWETVTTGGFRLEMLAGGHFYWQEQPRQLHDAIRDFLSSTQPLTSESGRAAE